jgi:quinoprotein glucose dehydrogenase
MKPITTLFACLLGFFVSIYAQTTEWPAYGRDAGGMRYAPIKQINSGNVKNLKIAWTCQTGELKTYEGTNAAEKAAFEATPLMIEGTLFFSTASCRVFAIDAATGKQKWVFDPKVDLSYDFSEITSRGVSAWPAGGQKATAGRKIFIGTIDGRLICLDAKTGNPITAFGNNGTVDLKEGLGRDISVTSPPAIIGNMVVVGSSLGDNGRFDMTRGTVRAYDVFTGKQIWHWDPIPQSESDTAWNTWQGTKAHKTGAANTWAVISADAQRDLVFIPTSSASPDYYGGERLGQNLYANSIVALRASTGKMVWHFQVVHHDLWDYDIAAQPVLMDITKAGKKVPAVTVGTKMGHIFILNRETGKPLFPVEERLVPASNVPGETAYKTQPFPVLPAPLGIQRITSSDAWGITEQDKKEAEERILQYRNEGIFTPPSYNGSLMTPGNVGGIHWGGMSFDAGQGLLITNINRLPAIIRMIPRKEIDSLNKIQPGMLRIETGRQSGTPYIMKRDYLFKITEDGFFMQSTPPWGTLLAIDINTGLKKWEVPLGFMMDPRKYPGAEKWGSINLGGAITTAGNITFVAATMDNFLRAFNTQTGELLWQFQLPASAQATPMSYQLNGKQYIVIAAGGHGKVKTKQGDYVMAFALE